MNSPNDSMSPCRPQNFLRLLHVGGAAIAGADGVDHDDVGGIERGVRIVVQPVRRLRHPAFGLHHDRARTEGAHVQPDGSRAGTAVVGERQRPLGGVGAVERVGDEEHLGFDFSRRVFDRHASGSRGVAQRPAVDGDLMMRLNRRDLFHIPVIVGGCALRGMLGFG